MEWSSQSPDLNPMENLWSMLKFRVQRRLYRSESGWKEVIMIGWNGLHIHFGHHFVDSMNAGVDGVILAKGGH